MATGAKPTTEKTGIENVEKALVTLSDRVDRFKNKSQDDRDQMAGSIADLSRRQALHDVSFVNMQADIARGAKASEEMSRDIKDMLMQMQNDRLAVASRVEQFRQIREDFYGPPHPAAIQRITNIETARAREIGIVIGAMFVAGLLGGVVQAWVISIFHH